MATSTFRVINPRAIRTAVMPTTQMVANQLVALVVAATPADTGALRSGWHVVPGRAPAVYLVENSVPHARYIEWGTVDFPGLHPMARAASAIRGRYACR